MQLVIASAMVALTVVMHLVGLWLLLALLRHHGRRGVGRVHRLIGILGAAFGLFALHTAEIWAYALLYWQAGALGQFEDSLYFSTVTYATIGYGDLVLPDDWRLVGAIEGASGVILLGWSTAFFVSIVERLKLVDVGS